MAAPAEPLAYERLDMTEYKLAHSREFAHSDPTMPLVVIDVLVEKQPRWMHDDEDLSETESVASSEALSDAASDSDASPSEHLRINAANVRAQCIPVPGLEEVGLQCLTAEDRHVHSDPASKLPHGFLKPRGWL